MKNNSFIAQNIDILAEAKTIFQAHILAAYKHKKYPFMGIQFHPEKTQFLFTDDKLINTSDSSIFYARLLARSVYILLGNQKRKMT